MGRHDRARRSCPALRRSQRALLAARGSQADPERGFDHALQLVKPN
jgi:hypothetical protein